MLFANGWGTPRDLDAATYFLCRAGDEMAPFEQQGMLEFLQGMRSGKETGKLDYCDHITSGMGGTWCAGLDYDRKKIDWDRRTTAVEKTLGADAKPALAALRKAAEASIKADATYIAEPNRGGTIYPSMLIGGEMDRGDDFIATLERYTQKRGPEASPGRPEESRRRPELFLQDDDGQGQGRRQGIRAGHRRPGRPAQCPARLAPLSRRLDRFLPPAMERRRPARRPGPGDHHGSHRKTCPGAG